jgi:hypothetical protein
MSLSRSQPHRRAADVARAYGYTRPVRSAAASVRAICLELPDASEASHHGAAAYKIFL